MNDAESKGGEGRVAKKPFTKGVQNNTSMREIGADFAGNFH